MGWARSRLIMGLGLMALVVASCGGGDGTPPTTGGGSGADTTLPSGDDAGVPSEQAADPDTGASSEEAPGERSAVITIDGEATAYALDGLTYSNVDGVDDLTFETCDPDFFGSGRFYAIGYAVDADGEILLDGDDQPAGTFTMDLPPDDWEATQRDAPSFDIDLDDLDIGMAPPEEAAGGTMAWTIDDTTASGSAVFVDFENTYTVDFEVVCEGSPTVNVEDLPAADDSDGGDDGDDSGFPLAGAGTGSFTADGESFDNVDVYRCEPFSFGSDPDPNDLSLLGYLGGISGLEVEVSHSQGFDMTDGTQFEQIRFGAFHSRSGDSGTEQFEGDATNDADGNWYSGDPLNPDDRVELAEPPFVIDGNRVSGALAGLDQTWPDEGAATVDVTFDFEIPTEVNEEC